MQADEAINGAESHGDHEGRGNGDNNQSVSEVEKGASVDTDYTSRAADTEVRGDDDDLGAGRASYGDDLETLDRRRTEELKLIGEYDS